uniref:Uncharacterized protein n=1 Tax=Oryza glumipatula TaxID=40148 RepID=A0A0D9Y3H4_9ORYZ
MEKPQREQMALMVPELLLVVATSEGVLTSIELACNLLDSIEFDVLVDTAHGVAFNTTGGGERCSGSPAPLYMGGGCGGGGGCASFSFGVPMDSTGGGEGSFSVDAPAYERFTFGVPMDTSGGGGVEHTGGDGAATNVAADHKGHKAGIDYWANTLASAFAADGPLNAAHREITRLITLHGVAAHLLIRCLELHDFPHGDEAAWQRWWEHHDAFIPRAHDALLRLSSATSAAAAAEDFLRLRSALSPGRNDWPSEAKQHVRNARRDIGEARDAVILMRDAAVREFFETWMILKRSQASR